MISVIFFIISQQNAGVPANEWKSPLDPGVKRFQEVIEGYLESQPESIQETLINLRARLAIAERKTDELQTDKGQDEQVKLKKPQYLRSLQAEVEHYNKLIANIEAQVIKEKRKDRSKKK